MEAILKFDLNDIDDKLSHLRCVKSLNMACLLFDIQNTIRRCLKYRELTKEQTEIIEKIQTEINEKSECYDINLENLLV